MGDGFTDGDGFADGAAGAVADGDSDTDADASGVPHAVGVVSEEVSSPADSA
ncbi:hypothetical protein [Catellatospora tritici]|uniref:hypothetical protein n=1 Tax=Catellatospora tritici TaxID=2851566 RepID=UPI001C2DCC34|nr:hypothetical protein [Catellatospora tritici]MBV1854783.1 hypothetical protein [Catellatospora tritici]